MEESESKDNIKSSDPNNHDTMSEQEKEYITTDPIPVLVVELS